MRRRTALGSLLALLAAAPKAIFAAEDSGNSLGSDFPGTSGRRVAAE